MGGLGYLFTDQSNHNSNSKGKSLLRWYVCRVLKKIFKSSENVNSILILQNKDDIETLVSARCVTPNNVALIRGAGVDMDAFLDISMPNTPPIIITCISRMLWDKGIGELVEAASILKELLKKQNGDVTAKVFLYGLPDPENPASIDEKQLQAWHDSGVVEWKGHCDEVAKAYAECHVAVLPSYRECLPKSLLEAASCGRPIVTTDVPGCREVVEDGVNGLLVPVKDAKRLAEALMKLCMDEAQRVNMRQNGRDRVKNMFSDDIIIQQTLNLY